MRKNKAAQFLNRRSFLGKTACSSMALTGVVNSLAHLKLIQSSLAQSTQNDGYKALVVVFLYGGNDSNNMLIPRQGHPQYNNYVDQRGILAAPDERHRTDSVKLSGGRDEPHNSLPIQDAEGIYGVHPNMPEFVDLFNGGDLSFVSNVGSLVGPLTRDQFLSGDRTAVPEHLFSHSDQQVQWQSSVPDQAFRTGWGGRVADELVHLNNESVVPFSMSLNGINRLQTGERTFQYSLGTGGPLRLRGHGAGLTYDNSLNPDGSYTTHVDGKRLQAYDALHGVEAYQDLEGLVYDHILEKEYASVVRNSRQTERILSAALESANDAAIDAAIPAGVARGKLGAQLKMVARVISGQSALTGVNRQIFFCGVSGFDTHKDQKATHYGLMGSLSQSLAAFNEALKATGNHDKVLTISHSDFTRTLTANGNNDGAGSDHGWGGHQVVMGGPVNGGQIFGDFPVLRSGGASDAGNSRGRWIPQFSVDQYSAVAANWMGVSKSDIFGADGSGNGGIFPNLHRFESRTDSNFAANYLL